MEKFKYLTKDKTARLPKTAGVYAFLAGSKILYIGKSANLKERVKTHLQQPNYRDKLYIDKIRKINKVQSTLTMMVIEEQESL